jgi:hypothetical protein
MNDLRIVLIGVIRPDDTYLDVDPEFGTDDEWEQLIYRAGEPVTVDMIDYVSELDEYEDDIADRDYWRQGGW